MPAFDSVLIVAALLIGVLGYALLVTRRERDRRQWRSMFERVRSVIESHSIDRP